MDNKIRAFYTEDKIRVYQAYNEDIAREAIKRGTFGSNFKLDRMTWIKPSFLWMMNSLHSRLLFLLQLYSDPFSRFDLSADNLRFLTMKLPWHISPFLLLCAYFCSVFNRGWNENVFRSNQRNAFHFILEVIKSQILLRYIVYRLLVVKN